MNSQDATNINNELLGDHGGGQDGPGRGPPDKPNISERAGTLREGDGSTRKRQPKEARELLKSLPAKERPGKVTKKTKDTTLRKKNETNTIAGNIYKVARGEGAVTKHNEEMDDADKEQKQTYDGFGRYQHAFDEAPEYDIEGLEGYEDEGYGGYGDDDVSMEDREGDERALRNLNHMLAALVDAHDSIAKMQDQLKKLSSDIEHWKDVSDNQQEELKAYERREMEYRERIQALEERDKERENRESEINKKIEKLSGMVQNKSREFDEQVALTVTKAHKAQQAAKEAGGHAREMSDKINDIEKQYEDKLGKIAVAIDGRFERGKREIEEEMTKFTKGVEDWKKEAAVVANKVKQTEVKVTTTVNTQKQATTNIARQIDSLSRNPWFNAADRKRLGVMSSKTMTQAKQPAPPRETYKIRILDPADLEEKEKMSPEIYADDLCALYRDEKIAVQRIWRTKTGKEGPDILKPSLGSELSHCHEFEIIN
jgi:hypothetical protein